MSKSTTMSFKIDKDLKTKAQQTAKAMGVPLSTLINAYLKDVAATGRVELTVIEEMTPQMERIIEEVEGEIARGELSESFDNAEDAIEFLHKLNPDDFED